MPCKDSVWEGLNALMCVVLQVVLVLFMRIGAKNMESVENNVDSGFDRPDGEDISADPTSIVKVRLWWACFWRRKF